MSRQFSSQKDKREAGFTVLHGLLALVVIFIVGFAGWYVSRSQADRKQDESSSTQNQNKQEDNKNSSQPDDWKTYESKDLGLKFSYPKVFGDMTLVTEYCCGLTKADYPDVESQYKSEVPKDSGLQNVRGDFFLETYKKEVKEIQSRKHGPKVRLMPNDGRWVVAETNPDDPKQYRIGMLYKEVSEQKSAAGVPIYIFETGNENNTTYQLVFQAKDTYHMLVLPSLYSGDNKEQSKKAYDALRDKVIKSISLVK